MIVPCDKCATKFRISEEKVTERGVKVRCSRCAHIFIVRRDAVEAAPKVRPPEPKTGRLDPSHMASLLKSSRPRGPLAASPKQAAMALGFVGRTPLPSVADASEPVTAQMDAPADAAARSTRSNGSSDFRSLDLPTPDLQASLQTSDRVPTEAAAHAASQAASAWEPRSALSEILDSNDFLGDGFLPAGSDNLATELIPPDEASAAGGKLAVVGAPPGNGADSLTPSGGLTAFPPPLGDSMAPVIGRSGDIPGLLPPGSIADDPFDNLDLLEAEPELPEDGAYAAFEAVHDDLSEGSPEPRGPSGVNPSNEALARIALETPVARVAGKATPGEATAVAPAYLNTIDLENAMTDRRTLWPSILGAVVGVLAILFAFPDIGRPLLEPYAPESVLALFGYVDAPSRDAVRGVRAIDTKAVPYRAVDGRALLVVAGRALNQTDGPIEGLHAVVRVRAGDRVLAEEEVPVGVTLRPRALYRVVNRESLEGAWAVARAEAPPGVLTADAERPFMAVFYDARSDQGARRIEVEFRSSGAAP